MTNERFESVWDAIEDTPAQAENMKLRSSLMMALKDHVAREGLSQAQAAQKFGVTQPRVSDLMRGKIELFGLDSLVNMAAAARLRVEMRVGAEAERWLREDVVAGHKEYLADPSKAVAAQDILPRIKARRASAI